MKPGLKEIECRSNTPFFCFAPATVGLRFDWHRHEEYELTCVAGGVGHRFVGDHLGGLGGTDLVLIGPNLPHAYQFAARSPGRGIRIVSVHFRNDSLGGEETPYPEFEAIHLLLAQARLGVRFCDAVVQDVSPAILQLPDQELFERHVNILRILDHLARSRDAWTILSSPGFAASRRVRDEGRVTRICTEIHRRSRESVTLDELAALANMSPAAFSRFFKRATGKTFKRYLNEVRIESACRLLAGTDLSVSEICFETGFHNLSNFNRRFLQIRSVSPMEYRRRSRRG